MAGGNNRALGVGVATRQLRQQPKPTPKAEQLQQLQLQQQQAPKRQKVEPKGNYRRHEDIPDMKLLEDEEEPENSMEAYHPNK